jgi:branched-subunit amino acid transport protein
MEIRPELLALVLACALVTALPRVLPLVLLSSVALPGWLLDWLRYVPIAVLAALAAIDVLMPAGQSLSLHWPSITGIAAAFAAAAWTRSLLATVVAGVAVFWLLAK